MTTRTRESGVPGKEKRGTSPSNIGVPGKEKRGTSPSNVATTTQHRSSPIPSKTNSPARNVDSEKRVPNYLKPTASSGTDVSKQQGKKPVSTSDSMQKPNLARRRSFDKPPSPSRTQTTRVSPNPTVRSSSFSGKVVGSQKVGSDRSLKGVKDVGKQHTLYARPVSTLKKGIAGIKKQETRSGAPAIKKEQIDSPPLNVHSPHIADIPEPAIKIEDQELINIEQVGNNHEEGSTDLALEDQEQGEEVKDSVLEDHEQGEEVKDSVMADHEQGEEVKDSVLADQEQGEEVKDSVLADQEQGEAVKDSVLADQEQGEGVKDSVLEDQELDEGVKDSVLEDQEPVNIEKTEVESDENESNSPTFQPSTDSEIQNDEIVSIDTSTVSDHDDTSLAAKTEELEEKSGIEDMEEQSIHEVNKINDTDEEVAPIEKVEETKPEQQQEQEQEATELNEKEETYESDETEMQEDVVEQKVEEANEEQKTETAENAVPRVQGVAHGKKDSPVSNDVIEETANKLREQRKNKVKALAGAFETVISLQESK